MNWFFALIGCFLCGCVFGVSLEIEKLINSLERDSAKIQTLLAEIRDKTSK